MSTRPRLFSITHGCAKLSFAVALLLFCGVPPSIAQERSVPISLSSSVSNAIVGEAITFTATDVTRFLFPGATVTFVDNDVVIPGSTTPIDPTGVASFTTTLPFGSHSVVARYSICCNTSNPVTVIVTAAGVPALSHNGLAVLALLLLISGALGSIKFANNPARR